MRLLAPVLLVLFLHLLPASCQIQQCNYPSLPVRDLDVQVVPTTSAGLEGWNALAQSFIDTAWSAAGFPYIVFDSSSGGFALYPIGAIPILAIVSIGFFLAFASILCCCIICCCWCCCCCYDNDDEDDGRRSKDKCRSQLITFIALLVLIVILLILVFVGAVIGFVAQSGVRTNLDSFPSTVTTAATGYRDYLDSVSEEISTVFVDNINTTVSCIQNRSNDVEDMLRLAIDDSSGILTHVSNLTGNGDSIGAQFTSAISNLDDISNTLASLTSLASNIRMNLSELMTMASGSGGPQVPTGMELQDSVATLNMTANPDTLIQEIMMANSTIQDSIRNPSSQFTSGFDKRIMEVVMNIDSVVNSIRSDTEEAANVSSTFTSSITFVRGIVSELVNVTSSLLMGTPIPSQPLLTYDTFEDVWYWVGVFFLILVLVAIVLTTIGLIVGGIPYTCPRALKRKTVSNCGSRLMLISIGSILIYNFLILLASAVGFFLGANLQEMCEPLRDDAAFARTVDNFDWRRSNLRVILSSLTSNNNDFENLLLATVDAQLLFAESLRSCERNEPIWTAFKLDDLLSSGNLQPSGQFQRIDIDSTLNVVRDLISATRGSINMTLETVLEDLANNITGQPDVMVNSPLDTTTIAMYVRSSLSAVEVARGNSSALLTQLNTLEQNYTQQNENTLAARTQSIIANVQMLENQLTTLTNQLMMLNNSNNEYTSQLSSANMSAAQYNQAKGTLPSALMNNGSAAHMAVLNVVDSVISPVAQFPDYILRSLNTEIGRCFPVWAGYTNMRNNVCLDLVNYINAFWFSLGWCAFWFSLMIIPLIIMGILFQRPIQYSMSFKDSNHIEMMKKRSSWSWERANSLGEALVQYPPTQIVVVQNPGDITPLIGGEMRTSVLLSESGSVGRPPKSEEPFEKTRRIQDRALPEIPLTDTYVEISPNKPLQRTKPGFTDRPLPTVPWEQSGASASSSAPTVENPPKLPSRELKEEYQPDVITADPEENEEAPLISSKSNSLKSKSAEEIEKETTAGKSAEVIENVHVTDEDENHSQTSTAEKSGISSTIPEDTDIPTISEPSNGIMTFDDSDSDSN